ncbi:helix-turn-helix transcriptional regulator [Loktanella sp. Alg231-35]|uniref:helix-turn-helix transcriptional regulator n=1 Tax=Loktanella sp. Alg231-35 TaxID=1922220 RepID=UPI00131F1C5C|nr:helix-turn-helix domain-containing protein [Loktanella sp. Alg231-35]
MTTDFGIEPRILSLPHAASYCGESRATLYREWKLGNLKFIKMGGSTRIERSELDRYIDAKMVIAA